MRPWRCRIRSACRPHSRLRGRRRPHRRPPATDRRFITATVISAMTHAEERPQTQNSDIDTAEASDEHARRSASIEALSRCRGSTPADVRRRAVPLVVARDHLGAQGSYEVFGGGFLRYRCGHAVSANRVTGGIRAVAETAALRPLAEFGLERWRLWRKRCECRDYTTRPLAPGPKPSASMSYA